MRDVRFGGCGVRCRSVLFLAGKKKKNCCQRFCMSPTHDLSPCIIVHADRTFALKAGIIMLTWSIALHLLSASYITNAFTLNMVEGHSVHRIASRFRTTLVGRQFAATSPNERFTDGAAAISGRVLSRMEAVGKNLFAFFSDGCNHEEVVVHVHFGMSGAWAVFDSTADEPEVKPTTRLRLEEIVPAGNTSKFITHLSAMTVQHGDFSLYSTKKASLGEDPLRSDADPNLLYSKIIKSKKSIGQLIMDQSYFSGPGNIYRAEILFLAGVYPTISGVELDRASFDRIWDASVKLLRRGYDTGSILTVDADVDPMVAARGERRYIYNRPTCARCGGRVSSWDMSGRTCYACESGSCQPKQNGRSVAAASKNDENMSIKHFEKKQHIPFISHCAPTSLQQRLEQHGSEHLTIAELRSVIEQVMSANGSDDAMPPKSAKKSVHVEALNRLLSQAPASNKPLPPPLISAEDAAREKAKSGENRAVEHVAELSRDQAIKAITVTPSPVVNERKNQTVSTENNPTSGRKRKRSSPRRLTYGG
jgi:formamidopyrimidine-DNA glycosylase